MAYPMKRPGNRLFASRNSSYASWPTITPMAWTPYLSSSSTHLPAMSQVSSGSSIEVMSVLDCVLLSKPSRVRPRTPHDFRVWAVKKWAWASTTSIPTVDSI